VPLGLYIVRGDNVVLIGEIDMESEGKSGLSKVSPEELAESDQAIEGKIEWDFDF